MTLQEQQKLINNYYDCLIKHGEAHFNFWQNGRVIKECNTLLLFLHFIDVLEYDHVTVIPF